MTPIHLAIGFTEVFSVHYVVQIVKCAVCSVKCAVCCEQCAVCSVKCALCSVKFALCSKIYIVYLSSVVIIVLETMGQKDGEAGEKNHKNSAVQEGSGKGQATLQIS